MKGAGLGPAPFAFLDLMQRFWAATGVCSREAKPGGQRLTAIAVTIRPRSPGLRRYE